MVTTGTQGGSSAWSAAGGDDEGVHPVMARARNPLTTWTVAQTQVLQQLGQRIRLLEARLDGLEQQPSTMWYTVNEMAAKYRVKRRTIYNWMQQDRFYVKRTPSGMPRLGEKCGPVRAAV